jgi:3-oxoacyl-[acyl-carrier-protein] synthase II
VIAWVVPASAASAAAAVEAGPDRDARRLLAMPETSGIFKDFPLEYDGMSNARIAVTGIGVISSIGCSREAFWKSLVAGTSGAGPITLFDAHAFGSRIACEARDFVAEDHLDRKRLRKMARFSQMASAAARMAVKDSGIVLDALDTSRVGCVIGSAGGDYENIESQHATLQAKGPGHGNPFAIPKTIANIASSNAAIDLGVHGPNVAVISACATGAHSIAGGAEAAISPLTVDSYDCMSVLSHCNEEPRKASRPFDLNRDGFVIAEGAAVLILETWEGAMARGAEIYAELKGYGMTCDAYSMAIPEPEGKWAAKAMEIALQRSRLGPECIGYINAHGTSTPANDKTETLAIKRVFASGVAGVPPVSSNKSMIGHALGAAGALEAAATVLSIHHGILPPTINLETPDPECDLDYIPSEARECRIDAAISNSFGFGGQNCVLCFGRAGARG